MGFARRRVVVPQRRRTATDWGRFVDQQTVIAAGTKTLLFSFILSNPGIGEVVRRTHVMLSIISDQATVLEQQNGAFGMIVVTDLALAAGAASIPGPSTDASDDGWFVWFGINQVMGTTLGATPTHSFAAPYVFESKAMRKIPDGFAVAVMYETCGQGSSVGASVSMLTSRT